MIKKLSFNEINSRHIGARPEVRFPIAMMLENVRSVYNVGSIFRTADAAHIRLICCAGITADPSHRGVAKTALGAQDVVPWISRTDPVQAARELRAEGYTLAALELTDSPTEWSALEDSHFPVCMMVGNEVKGLSERLLEECDLALEIPQFGSKQSLNVSVAAGIAVYRLLDRLVAGAAGRIG